MQTISSETFPVGISIILSIMSLVPGHILVANAEFQKLRYMPRKDKSITLYKPVIRLYSPDICLHNSSVSVKKRIYIRQYNLNHCKQRLLRTSVVTNNIVNLYKSQHAECMC